MTTIDNIMALADEYAAASIETALSRTGDLMEFVVAEKAKKQALRAAIEQALTPGEPVAWITDYELSGLLDGFNTSAPARAMRVPVSFPAHQVVPLYTAPQPQPKQETVKLKRGITGRCTRKYCECEKEGLGLECIHLEPLIDGYPMWSGIPQPQREWVGLTDEEVTATMQTQAAAVTVLISPRDQVTAREFQQALNHIARAVEAKLREKNGGTK